ncbi:RluA family pseudouridine synthase [Oricola sp.]|uniref:RluA family pseudouridine synthase n=1 Tax=Oricola sp. TaxID=1979950 RepID=UPI003BAB9CDA
MSGQGSAKVEQKDVDADEAGMRVDRWFKLHYPDLAFGALQKLLRTGQVRIDGKRAKSDTRLEAGQSVRIPPGAGGTRSSGAPLTARTMRNASDGEALRKMILYEDRKVLVLNKPAGLAVQGGSGVTRHIDGMLEAFRNQKGEKPRLVHRIDRDTSGILVIARTRGAAQRLTAAFRERDTKKTYWALVKGVPGKREGRISTWLVKEPTPDGDRMRVCKHGEPDADHAVSDYRIVETAGQKLTWLEMEPVTGRTHQLRVHALHMGCPMIGDPKYFEDDPNWEFPGGIQKKLHLHARRIVIPHPDGGTINATAPLPPHMVQSWNLLGFSEKDSEAG